MKGSATFPCDSTQLPPALRKGEPVSEGVASPARVFDTLKAVAAGVTEMRKSYGNRRKWQVMRT